jgi:hypothetical protein
MVYFFIFTCELVKVYLFLVFETFKSTCLIYISLTYKTRLSKSLDFNLSLMLSQSLMSYC